MGLSISHSQPGSFHIWFCLDGSLRVFSPVINTLLCVPLNPTYFVRRTQCTYLILAAVSNLKVSGASISHYLN